MLKINKMQRNIGVHVMLRKLLLMKYKTTMQYYYKTKEYHPYFTQDCTPGKLDSCICLSSMFEEDQVMAHLKTVQCLERSFRHTNK